MLAARVVRHSTAAAPVPAPTHTASAPQTTAVTSPSTSMDTSRGASVRHIDAWAHGNSRANSSSERARWSGSDLPGETTGSIPQEEKAWLQPRIQ